MVGVEHAHLAKRIGARAHACLMRWVSTACEQEVVIQVDNLAEKDAWLADLRNAVLALSMASPYDINHSTF